MISTEWVRARDAMVDYAHHRDAYGTESKGRALLVGNDDVVAIEGTPDELLALLERMASLVRNAPALPIRVRIQAVDIGNDITDALGWQTTGQALVAYPKDNPHLPPDSLEFGIRYVSPEPDGAQDCEAHVEEMSGALELVTEDDA